MGDFNHGHIQWNENLYRVRGRGPTVSTTNKKIHRSFHKGKYKDLRKYLAKLDWNNMLRNKTVIECWNILKNEIESIIDKFVPLKKQGKQSRKKQKKLLEK